MPLLRNTTVDYMWMPLLRNNAVGYMFYRPTPTPLQT